ncbi:MAG TPA: DUF4118 domain-containing protein, partial [Acidimicrobiales bacterium]|nr:DUF4118 domain-containing protein [Acidimicrobiales bacterium]
MHVYLGIAPGVGKTTAMLHEARRQAAAGRDVVVGLVDTHGRSATDALLGDLEVVPPRVVRYRDTNFEELDVDAVAALEPDTVVVDELPHTCVPGSRHTKRWEDVVELLGAGIDVITALNVQHLDSLQAEVESLTGTVQRESVPDAVVASADRVDLVDASPDELRARILGARVLDADAAGTALERFFRADRLAGLRRLAIAWFFDHRLPDEGPLVPEPPQREARAAVVVALDGAPGSHDVLRRASELAVVAGADLLGVHVREPGDPSRPDPPRLAAERRVLAELGGHYHELAGMDVARTVLEFVAAESASHLVLGAPRRSAVQELLHGSVVRRAVRAAGPVEVVVVPPRGRRVRWEPVRRARYLRAPLPLARRVAAWTAAVGAPAAIVLSLVPLRSSLGLPGALLSSLVGVVGVALLGGVLPALLATAVAVGLSDFYFAPPIHSFRVARLVDVIALVVFALV